MRLGPAMLLAPLLVCSPHVAQATPYDDGVAALKDGLAAEARPLLEQATATEPRNPEAWWELGWACWTLSDYGCAANSWERVSKLNPEQAELDVWLAAARTQRDLAAIGTVSADIPLKAEGQRVRFAAAGDTMMGSDLRKGAAGLAPGNGEELFGDVAPLFKAADIAFLNLEGPLADGLPSTKCGANSTSCYAFRTPTRYKAALVWAGIDVVSLANNHAMDLGVPGQDATMAALDSVGIRHAGRYGDTALLDVNGTKVAVVAAHFGSCCLNVNRPAEVAAAVALADREADIVVLSFHGGAEGGKARHTPGEMEIAWGEQRGDVTALARAAVDAGADLVLGSGPHVLRGIEVYKNRLVVYSMGNFIGYNQFGTEGGYGGTSMIVDAELASNGVLVAARIHPLLLDSSSRPSPDPEGAALDQVRELTEADLPEHGVRVQPDGTLTWNNR